MSEMWRKGWYEEPGVRHGAKTKEAAGLPGGSSFERRQLPLKLSQKNLVQKFEESLRTRSLC
jgi:hypothetical protein